MEERRRGVGAGMVKFVFALLLLTILCGRLAMALDDDGELLMLFKLLMLDGWSVSDASACAWNGVICNGFPAPQQAGATANVTSTTDGISNTTTLATVPARANGTTTIRGLNASAVTVSRVIGLVLPNAQLSATLPPDLARLQHLRHLDLSGNKVTGTLPPALLLNATDLRVLALAGNDITGSLPDGAPSHGLQELNLSDNTLVGWLPDTLLMASGLTVLGLSQ